MTDGLTQEERSLAWLADWHPSFSGKAIVNPDFSFRAVNPQFCKLLGVTPAEVIGQKFSDITPQPLKDLDIRNAELVKSGQTESYLLPKTYELPSGKRVDVTLLVSGVYHEITGEFLFFVSTIMERKRSTSLQPLCQMPTGLLGWIDKKKVGWALLTMVASILAALWQKYGW